jgi:hypothetical protein
MQLGNFRHISRIIRFIKAFINMLYFFKVIVNIIFNHSIMVAIRFFIRKLQTT